MHQHDIGFPSLPHRHRGAGTDGNGKDRIAGLFLEHRNEHVKQPGVLGARRRGENHLF